jgi:hypothetical protein
MFSCQTTWKFSVVPFLRLFLIVLGKLVVAQGRWHHNVAGVEAGAEGLVPNFVKMSCGRGSRHGVRWIAARAIIRGSIAALAAL